MFHAQPETSCPRATLNIHDCPTNYPATKDAYCATCPSWESPVKFARSTNIKKSSNCWGVRFGIAIVQWLETTPKSLSLIIRCWVHTSYGRITSLFTSKVHLEVEMNPNLRDRERHHPNASKELSQYRKRFRESIYSTKFLVSLCLGECAWLNDTMFLFKRSCNT